MNKASGILGIISLIVLASECEFTLSTIIAKIIALAVLAGIAFLSSREPAKVPARRMRK